MIDNHDSKNTAATADAESGAPASPAGRHCGRCGKDLSFAAYIIGASVLVGAVLISATLLYIFKTASHRLDSVIQR